MTTVDLAVESTATAIGHVIGQQIGGLTADDLLQMPDDGMRHELVKGVLTNIPPAGGEHGAITVKATLPIGYHVSKTNLGVVFAAETGFIIARDPDTVRAPDVAFILRERIPESGIPRGYVPIIPDLVVEVVSPHDRVFEVDEKVEEWLNAGVRLVWVVNPKRRTVAVYRSLTESVILNENDELDGYDVLSGFRLRVAEIFT